MSQKKKLSFPSAFSVLFIVLILAAMLTYLVPAGSYSKLSYNGDDQTFHVLKPDGSEDVLPGTQATLDSLKVKIDVVKFEDGSVYKPVAIPGTYETVSASPQGFLDVLKSPIQGVYDTIDIIMFVFILGGMIGVINHTGAFDAGIAALSRATKGKEFILIIVVSSLIALGGTTFGMAEETIALYPILIPIFLATGYDAIVCIAAIYMGSSVGTMFSTVNPFATVIASNAAGITFTEGLNIRLVGLVLSMIITLAYIIRYAQKVKKDPSLSLVADQKQEIEERFLKNYDPTSAPAFNVRRILMLVIFFGSFVWMVIGVSKLGWWFEEMTALFLGASLLIGFLSGLSEKTFVDKFVAGAADLIGVALIIGVARAINGIMDAGMISDTILYYASGAVAGMNGGVFSIVMMLVFAVLGFFIPSSSGLAVLSMPIMAPLADTVGLPRDIIVSAYTYGQGLMAFITPTGLILATLAMVDITYDKWIKFIMPLMGLIGGFAAVMLIIQAVL